MTSADTTDITDDAIREAARGLTAQFPPE